MGIILKNRRELARMRETGRIVRDILDVLETACVPGTTTAELNRIAARELERVDARSAFLGYRPRGAAPYPAVLCTSVNDVVVHGIPREDEVLREGDVVGIDFACYKDGWCADSARTIAVGVISQPVRSLLDATRESLARAIEQCQPGRTLGDVGAAVEEHVTAAGFSVVRGFVGHGIGRAMHEPPEVPNFGKRGVGVRLTSGMVLAIEPMVNEGGAAVSTLEDGWTIVTRDGRRSAHFEHSVAITNDGPMVLTG